MSRISQADKDSMYALAVEIIELQAENEAARAKGYDPDSTQICNLYDQADSEFSAARVKSLLDELRETQAENQRLRNGVKDVVVTALAPAYVRSITITTVKEKP